MIPAFLISSAISFGGTTKRDYELMTMMKNSGPMETFVGRKVLPEAIKTVKDYDLSEEGLSTNVNPNVRDYFFCSECEKRIGVIEDYFAREIHDKLESGSIEVQKGDNGYDLSFLYNEKSWMSRLFFLSIFWRVSLAAYLPLALPAKVENKIRLLIHECSDVDLNETMDKSKGKKEDLLAFPLVITLFSNEKDKTKRLIYGDQYRFPHLFILNRYVAFLYEKQSHINNPVNTYFGLTALLNKEDVISKDCDLLPVCILTQAQTESIRQEIFKMMINKTRDTVRINFGKVYEKLFGSRPTDDIIYTITHRIVHHDVPTYDRYSEPVIIDVMVKFVQEINEYMLRHGKPLRYSIGDIHPDKFKLPRY